MVPKSTETERITCLVYLSLIADCGFVGKLHLGGLEDRVLLEDRGLALVVPKRLLAVQALVEDHADAPHVHLAAYLWWVFADYKTLRRQIPVGWKRVNISELIEHYLLKIKA